MAKYFVTLEIETNYNPNKWNWHEILDFYEEGEELLSVDIEQVKEIRI
jgi:hypothetical protein